MEMKVVASQEIFGNKFDIYGSVDDPWFLAKDIADWIDYNKSSLNKMINAAEDSEKVRKIVPTLGGNQEMWFLTEDGMNEVLMQSRKPKAKEVKKEIKQILKDIRKHGAYMTPEKIEEVLLNPDTIINLANQLKTERAERERLEKKVIQDAPKVLFADQLAKTKQLSSVGDYAKTLCTGGFEIGQNRLFEWLRANKFLMKTNLPYQQHLINGAFQVKKYVHVKNGIPEQRTRTMITPKGQLYLFKKMLKDPDLGLAS